MSGRILPTLDKEINLLLEDYEDSLGSLFSTFPAEEIGKVIEKFAGNFKGEELDRFNLQVASIIEIVQRYRQGVRGHSRDVIVRLLKEYYDIEKLFNSGKPELQILAALIDKHKGDMGTVCNIALAHCNDYTRSEVVCALLDWLNSFSAMTPEEKSIIKNLAALQHHRNAKVALRARKFLIKSHRPTFVKRKLEMEVSLQNAIESFDASSRLKELTLNADTYFDVLTTFFYHHKDQVRMAALEIYTRRAYNYHHLQRIRHRTHKKGFPFLEFTFQSPQSSKAGMGLILAVLTLSDLGEILSEALGAFLEEKSKIEERVFAIVIKKLEVPSENPSDETTLSILSKFIQNFKTTLSQHRVERLTFTLLKEKSQPIYFTFRESMDWEEDKILRFVEPGLSYQLELHRLGNYNIEFCNVGNNRLHVYYAKSKPSSEGGTDSRFFMRCLVHQQTDPSSEAYALDYWIYEGEKIIVSALSALELLRNDPKYGNTDRNHIFCNFVTVLRLDIQKLTESIIKMLTKHGEHFWKLRVTDGEIILNVFANEKKRLRLFIHNQTGFIQQNTLKIYEEQMGVDGSKKLIPFEMERTTETTSPNVPDLPDINRPYSTGNNLQRKRYFAQSQGTSYIYDIPSVFNKALLRCWRQYGGTVKMPKDLLEVTEYRLNSENELVESSAEQIGNNDISMVMWKMKICTPEIPEGREIVVISNDITLAIGSFAPLEDILFKKASEFARKLGIPRIYVSVNSGARIGLADEVKNLFKVAFKEEDPSKGFNYIYLSPEDFKKLNSVKNVVNGELIDVHGELRYKISDIIGGKDGLGVENLRGSGMIAGETSLAYDEIFTISLVTCRSVGIGAYLVRLGQRVVQVESSPIILTGAAALNKVLGRKVYLSNDQIGGTSIMYTNGVSHLTAKSDLHGVELILKWISFLPKTKWDPLPILKTEDPIDRDVEFSPTPHPYDPRWLLAGRVLPNNTFQSGFFDKGSFMETLSGWAQNVIVGRGRLGGIPLACIAVETRTIELVTPADPAEPESITTTIHQAGQVWFPNSAFKTAQAIQDFNNEKLPLIIFANWRGFSGGMRDMLSEILKFGSYIVDNLRKYTQPVFVYIPPFGELRGGAWVVVDPTINPDMMEMHADEFSRGGVLEPEGTVEIKYREPDLFALMGRLDPELINLNKRLSEKAKYSEVEIEEMEKLSAGRKKYLLPIYLQIAKHFVDLHDTPGRMKAKECISQTLQWKNSRRFFALRLQRRLLEENFVKKINSGDKNLNHAEALGLLKMWFLKYTVKKDWNDDKAVLEWLENSSDEILLHIEKDVVEKSVLQQITDLAEKNPKIAVNTIITRLVELLSPEQCSEVMEVLKKKKK